MIGQTLAHYQILEKLGEGGMGVVYKALDTHLNRRFVALKLLSANAVSNPEHRKRFVQEARAASALNHPHIVTIYDIASHDNQDFIAMEFIQGKTLHQLLRGKGLPLSDTLKYSAQIADALAKAHAAGIVHRDLKPANIMVTEDKQVKLLDFGLAKLVEPDYAHTEAPTLAQQDAAPKTEEGAVCGTPAYMSPEQVEGRKLDARTDIFSFGSVLYEMSTGRRAFRGETKVSTLSAVLRDEPRPATELSGEIARELERIIKRCLRKDPERRFQSMKDIQIELDELKEESDSGTLRAAPRPSSDSQRWVVAMFAVVLLVAGGAALWWSLNLATVSVEWQLRPLTADSGLTTTPALSQDGKLASYASDRASNGANLDLWIQPLAEGSRPIRLTQDPADDMNPSFSPDGGQIAFYSAREGGGIYLVPTFGGEVRLLALGGRQPRFSPDGRWVAYAAGVGFQSDAKVFVIPAVGGATRQIAADLASAMEPVWSPDGRHLLVLGTSRASDIEGLELWLVSPEGGASVKTGLMSSIRKLGRLPTPLSVDWVGDALYFGLGSSIWTIGFKTNGAPQPGDLRKVASSTTQMADVRGTRFKLAFESRAKATHLWSLPLELNSGQVQGPLQPLTNQGGSQDLPSSSLDGRWLAYNQSAANSYELRLRDMNTGTEKVLSAGFDRPKISPDGTKIAFSRGGGRPGPLFLIEAQGGEATKLLDPPGGVFVYGWSADGKWIVYWQGIPIRFSLFNLQTHQTHDLISHPEYNIHGAELSPDGKWVVFHLPSSRNELVKVAPMREGKAAAEAEWITVTAALGRNYRPWWSPDGNLLYFLSTRDGYACIWAQRLEPATKRPRGEPMLVYHLHGARRSLEVPGPAVGKGRIVFTLAERSGNIWLAEPAAPER